MAGDNNERIIQLADRTIERSRGCWSCIGFDNGDGCKTDYRNRPDVALRKMRVSAWDMNSVDFHREVGRLKAQGLTQDQAVHHVMQQKQQEIIVSNQLSLFDRQVENGEIGRCRIGGVDTRDNPVDFIHMKYLCHKWSGRDGSSVATSGRPLDKLPDELRDDADSAVAKKTSVFSDKEDKK